MHKSWEQAFMAGTTASAVWRWARRKR